MSRERHNLTAAFKRVLEAEPDRMVAWESERRLTAAHFLAIAGERQRQLSEAGIRAEDPVLVCNQRGIRYWADLVALWGLGAVAVPFDIKMPREQAHAVLTKTNAKAIITGHGEDPFNTNLPAITGEYEGHSGAALTVAQTRPETVAAILFTSGSTGTPKGVTETHGALLGNAWATLDVLGLGPSDRLVMATPYLFISAFSHFLVCFLAGTEFVATEQRLFKGDLAARINDTEATWFGGSPLQVRWIGEVAKNIPFPSLRAVMSSGDHLGVDVIELVRHELPEVDVFTVYGMTELAGRFCVLPPADVDQSAGAVGRPIAGLSAVVLDETTGEPLPAGELGEVAVRGEYVFDAYHNDPATTAECLEDGLFLTGDLGVMGSDGLLRLKGRKDDIFKYGGQKVSALPIAETLMKTNAFADVAVAGVPDQAHGHVPFVFYTSVNGQPVEPRSVMLAIREKLPASHRPAGFIQVSEIPRTGSGKILRAWLREQVRKVHKDRGGLPEEIPGP